MLVISFMPPSAVWARLMPSLALRLAMLRPRTSEVMRVAMARPAASSLAELMRLPVDRRSIAWDRPISALVEADEARIAEILVPITVM